MPNPMASYDPRSVSPLVLPAGAAFYYEPTRLDNAAFALARILAAKEALTEAADDETLSIGVLAVVVEVSQREIRRARADLRAACAARVVPAHSNRHVSGRLAPVRPPFGGDLK